MKGEKKGKEWEGWREEKERERERENAQGQRYTQRSNIRNRSYTDYRSKICLIIFLLIIPYFIHKI